VAGMTAADTTVAHSSGSFEDLELVALQAVNEHFRQSLTRRY